MVLTFDKYFGKKTKFLVITIMTCISAFGGIFILMIPFIPNMADQTGYAGLPLPETVSIANYTSIQSNDIATMSTILIIIFVIELFVWLGLGIHHLVNAIQSRKSIPT